MRPTVGLAEPKIVGRRRYSGSSGRTIRGSFSRTTTRREVRATVRSVNRVGDLWKTDRGRLAHYLVAAGLAVFVIAEMATMDEHRVAFLACGVVAAVALLLTRDAPFVAPLVVAGAMATTLAIDAEAVEAADSPFLTVILFLPWCLAAYNDRAHAVAGLIVMQGVGVWANLRFADTGVGDYFWIGGFIAAAWTTGFILSRRSEHTRQLAERARRLERERVEAAERAVEEERSRIARELHDVVGHSVSVMTVQASAVRRLLREDQVKEREALLVVEETGRQALAEMRRLVGVLRRPEEAPALAPQPSLQHLESLVARVRESGLPVTLRLEGEPRALPPGLDLTAYRLVQEGLTNARKHAQASNAEVVVRYGDGDVELEVIDDGIGVSESTSDGGHGLVGMRERVAVYGGELHAGPRAEGGYSLRARLPVTQS
jgi:signal transduction histidine kinase